MKRSEKNRIILDRIMQKVYPNGTYNLMEFERLKKIVSDELKSGEDLK
jgi:methyl coenzyme M reductase subunit D